MSEVFCNKCGFYGEADERGNHNRPGDGKLCHYAAVPTGLSPNAEAIAAWNRRAERKDDE